MSIADGLLALTVSSTLGETLCETWGIEQLKKNGEWYIVVLCVISALFLAAAITYFVLRMKAHVLQKTDKQQMTPGMTVRFVKLQKWEKIMKWATIAGAVLVIAAYVVMMMGMQEYFSYVRQLHNQGCSGY